MKTTLDPWGSNVIEDYSKLFDEFGISPFEPLLERLPDPHPYMRRGIIFGHRDYELILDAILNDKPFAVMSGFMPSGKVHLGAKMVMDEIIWHQRNGGDAFVGIADMEAYSVRGISWKRCREIGIDEYILSLIALGFEPEGHIYFQSKTPPIKDLSFELGIEANFSELSAIYGLSPATKISHMISILAQSADILNPQLMEYKGPKPVIVPVGSDQDPHIRLVRDIADRMRLFRVEEREDYISVRSKNASQDVLKAVSKRVYNEKEKKIYEGHVDIYGECDINEINEIVRSIEIDFGGYGFFMPSSTYHHFMSGLTGGKMSSSIPDSYIALTDDPKEAAEKVKRAKTGGRATLDEQKKLGGEPENCTVYELMLFHLIEDDDQIKEILEGCKDGKMLCGSCKKLAAELMFEFLKEHQKERASAKERLDEYGID
ncbi:MAG: tryptophan--tRNA ligase [Halobacteriota archaeon]|nr:tryptophan--tRNA ligase [Halobacteriota archaeon]